MSDLTNEILIEIRDEMKATRMELRQEIAGVRLEVAGVREDVVSVRDEVAGVREDVVSVREEVAGVHEDVASVRDELRQINRRLNTHEQVFVKIADVLVQQRRSLDRLTSRVDNFFTGAHRDSHNDDRERIDALDARVTRLEGKKPGGRRRAG